MQKTFDVFEIDYDNSQTKIGEVNVLNDIFTDEQKIIVLGKINSSNTNYNGNWVKCQKTSKDTILYLLFNSNNIRVNLKTYSLKLKQFKSSLQNMFTVFGQRGFKPLKIKNWDKSIEKYYGKIEIKSWCSQESQEIAIIELKDMKKLPFSFPIKREITICEEIEKEFDSINPIDGGKGGFNNAYILTKGTQKYILRLTYCLKGECWKTEMYGLLMQELLRTIPGLENGICKIYDFGTYSNATYSKKDQGAYAIMEYLPTSFDKKTISEYNVEEKTEKFNQLLTILKNMHINGYAHLDIKFDNVRMDETGKIKLFDFTFAQYINTASLEQLKNRAKHTCISFNGYKGTPGYLDPIAYFVFKDGFNRLCLSYDLYAVGYMILNSFNINYATLFEQINTSNISNLNLYKSIIFFTYCENIDILKSGLDKKLIYKSNSENEDSKKTTTESKSDDEMSEDVQYVDTYEDYIVSVHKNKDITNKIIEEYDDPYVIQPPPAEKKRWKTNTLYFQKIKEKSSNKKKTINPRPVSIYFQKHISKSIFY
jgi:serine/threonine protein kinase